ncbi:MAG: methyltransferase [Chloroflexota bacterium]
MSDQTILDWQTVQQITQNENACFTVTTDGDIEKIQAFSEEFNRLYSLMPVEKPSAPKRKPAKKGKRRIVQDAAPTMLISAIPMHRIKDTTPQLDTKEKIRAAGKIKGTVLDTATGLGYTAIAAAQTATSVTTIELDSVALEICRQNPWSQPLFDDPKITQEIGDSFDVVETLDNDSFDVIIHDPPMFSMAGHLYSADFYAELLRVLRPKSTLFHYIGNPESKSGRNTTKGVLARIADVGFVQIRPQPRAFGITAQKP